MRSVALLYHDVLENGSFDASGFAGADADIYKLDVDVFREHLAAIKLASSEVVITVDDGGVSAFDFIAPILETYGLRGRFFIATNWIGHPRFLNREQISTLWQHGHVIGSHSCSHPARISHCNWEQICDEWKRSTDILSNIVGEQVREASVPGGYYARRVAEAASISGISTLFTSEPTTKADRIGGCDVIGRYMIQRHTPPQLAAALARGDALPRLQQALMWNAKKAAKAVGGTAWLRLRKRIFASSNICR